MPYHKPRKLNNQQNKSSVMEETQALRPKKQAESPPNLNEIPKQES
ncbi:hypothetical protein [Paenibacillus sp. CAA11]|nr:hypothetical protein [Paenibacillus sp. CAA11]